AGALARVACEGSGRAPPGRPTGGSIATHLRAGDEPDEADRDLACLVGDGQFALSLGAAAPARAADPRRRGPVGGCLPDEGGRVRLLHRLRAEVALRSGFDRSALRA